MKTLAPSLLGAALLAGCAGLYEHDLRAGSTVAEVEKTFGAPALRRPGPDGETVLWFPRMPYGDGSYAARIGRDGRLIALEQRLSEEYIARLERGKTTAEGVLDLVGPPYRVSRSPRQDREVWTYKQRAFPEWKALFVQMSPDKVVREVYYIDDPEIPRHGAGDARP